MKPLAAFAHLAPEMTLLISLLTLAVFDWIFKTQRPRLTFFALAGFALALYASLAETTPAPTAIFRNALAVDSWTMGFRVLAFGGGLGACFLTLTRRFFVLDGEACAAPHAEFSLLVMLSALGVCFLAASRDLLVTVLALELLSLPLYALLPLAGTRRSDEAAAKYFLQGAAATACMLFGLAFITATTGSTRYAPIAQQNPLALCGLLFFMVGLFFKAAIAPFHSWTPDVYEAGPTPLVVFLATAGKAGAFAALMRLFVDTLPADYLVVRMLMALAALTMFLGNGAALAQTSVKRLLGYSAIAHAGFMLMAVAAAAQTGEPLGRFALFFYLLGYLPGMLAALAVIAVVEKGEHRKAYETGDDGITRLAGLYHRRPWLALAFVVALASLAGFPPSLGFWGKFEILAAAFKAGQLGLIGVALLNMLVAAAYYGRLMLAVFRPGVSPRPSGAPAGVALALLAALFLLAFGLWPQGMWRVAAVVSRAFITS